MVTMHHNANKITQVLARLGQDLTLVMEDIVGMVPHWQILNLASKPIVVILVF